MRGVGRGGECLWNADPPIVAIRRCEEVSWGERSCLRETKREVEVEIIEKQCVVVEKANLLICDLRLPFATRR